MRLKLRTFHVPAYLLRRSLLLLYLLTVRTPFVIIVAYLRYHFGYSEFTVIFTCSSSTTIRLVQFYSVCFWCEYIIVTITFSSRHLLFDPVGNISPGLGTSFKVLCEDYVQFPRGLVSQLHAMFRVFTCLGGVPQHSSWSLCSSSSRHYSFHSCVITPDSIPVRLFGRYGLVQFGHFFFGTTNCSYSELGQFLLFKCMHSDSFGALFGYSGTTCHCGMPQLHDGVLSFLLFPYQVLVPSPPIHDQLYASSVYVVYCLKCRYGTFYSKHLQPKLQIQIFRTISGAACT